MREHYDPFCWIVAILLADVDATLRIRGVFSASLTIRIDSIGFRKIAGMPLGQAQTNQNRQAVFDFTAILSSTDYGAVLVSGPIYLHPN